MTAALAFSIPNLAKSGLTEDEQAAVQALGQQLAVKYRRNALRAAYYDSEQTVRHLGIAVPPQLQDVHTVLGWPEKSVSDLEERIDLEGFVLPDSDWSDHGLDVVWSQNHLAVESSQAHTSALKFSATFVAVVAGQDGEPEVVVRPLSALATTARWNRHLRRVHDGLTVVSSGPDGVVEFILYTDTAVVTCTRTASGWSTDRREHGLGRAPLAVLPFRPSLERPFGRSRISRPVMSITDRAVRTLLRSEVTAEFFSAPQRYLLGADEDSMKDEEGNPLPGWTALIGRINAINANEDGDVPTIWQAPQQSMQPHLEMLRSDAMAFSGETGVSPSSLGIVHDNPASDAAMKTAYLKLVKTAERAHTTFGMGWVDTMRLSVMVRDGLSEPPPELAQMEARFRRADEPTVGEAADAAVKQVSAVPWLAESEVLLERMGYSRSEITRLMADRRRAEGRRAIDALIGASPAEAPADDQQG